MGEITIIRSFSLRKRNIANDIGDIAVRSLSLAKKNIINDYDDIAIRSLSLHRLEVSGRKGSSLFHGVE